MLTLSAVASPFSHVCFQDVITEHFGVLISSQTGAAE
jgi:hypothetical protein